MEFTEDTDMNSALVKVSNKLDQAKSDLPLSLIHISHWHTSSSVQVFSCRARAWAAFWLWGPSVK